jgi:hypothetical protein
MGIGNDLIVNSLKENAKEIKEKQARGEKLSIKNYLLLLMQLGFFVISAIVSIYIIKLCLELLK